MSSADPEKAMEVADDDAESSEEVEDQQAADSSQLTKELLKNPAVMAALQGKLDGMVGTSSGYIQSLPAAVKQRIKALKKLQFECTEIEAKFYEEVHALEVKYQQQYQPLYNRRTTITSGSYEPTEEECDWPSEDEEDEDDLADDVKDKVKLNNGESKGEEEDVKGVPEFWLTIFKNVDILQEMVQEHDEPVLASLKDIEVTLSEKPMGFALHFHFEPNDFFTDSVLTKRYEMKCEPSEGDSLNFEGPEIYKCSGCEIQWKEGKNITVKSVKRKQKHKSKGSVRTITKQIKNDSFFNFFNPPDCPENDEEIDDDTQELLTSDFEIGHYIRERVVPRAVLYFTGEALEDDDYGEEEEEEEGEEGEEEEEDPDYDPSKAKEKPQECKQQ